MLGPANTKHEAWWAAYLALCSNPEVLPDDRSRQANKAVEDLWNPDRNNYAPRPVPEPPPEYKPPKPSLVKSPVQ